MPSGLPPQNDPFWKDVPPDENPWNLWARADALKQKVMGATVYGQGAAARALQQEQQNLQAKAWKVVEDGYAGGKPIEGILSAKRAQEAQTKAAGTYSEAAAKDMNEEEGQLRDTLPALQDRAQRLDDMQTLLQGMNTGPGTETWAHAQNIAQRWGLNLGDPSSVYEFMKNSYIDSFDIVRTMKGQVRNMELQSAGKQVPSVDLPLAANLYLIDRMRGAVGQEMDYLNAFRNWRQGGGANAVSPNMFAGNWFADNPYRKYINPQLAGAQAKQSKTESARPENLPPGAVRGTSSTGRKGWFDPPTGKAWDLNGKPF